MIQKLFAQTVILFFVLVSANAQKTSVHVSDITHFWEAYDSVKNTNDKQQKIQFIQKLYIDRATIGLQEFMNLKGSNAAKWANMIEEYGDSLQKIRPYTLAVLDQVPIIEEKLAKLKELYPNFQGGDIFFTIGIRNSGGTIEGKHVLIGSEVVASPKENWAVPIVMHEFIHTIQNPDMVNHLLANCIMEGMADFGAELLCGQSLGAITPDGYTAVGLKNEVAVWKDFKKYINYNINNQYFDWLYGSTGRTINGITKKDFGYFIGHQICKSYYDAASDKKKALTEIFELHLNTDEKARQFLLASGYAPDKDVAFIKNFQFSHEIKGVKSKIYGYKIKSDIIIFNFQTKSEQKNIKSVAVAGNFNEWNPQNEKYQMTKINQNTYQLQVPLSSFKKGESYQFKFVVNGDEWQNPPIFAKNLIVDGGGNLNLLFQY